MFKTNGEKALLAILVITLISIGFTGFFGIGQQAAAGQTDVQGAVKAYFEKLPDDSNRISGADLKEFIGFNKDALYIVDIREAKDYKTAHIDGAINIPFKEIGKEYQTFPKNKTIVVYCYTGQNGGQVVALLNTAGYKAKSLSGGWGGWLSVSEETSSGSSDSSDSNEAPASCS